VDISLWHGGKSSGKKANAGSSTQARQMPDVGFPFPRHSASLRVSSSTSPALLEPQARRLGPFSVCTVKLAF
jgi:hypothetical protein